MDNQTVFNGAYIKAHIERILPGQYIWVKHYLYRTWHRWKDYSKPVSIHPSNARLIKHKQMQDHLSYLDLVIINNVRAALSELQEYYQQWYMQTNHKYAIWLKNLTPEAHYERFQHHLRRAKGFHDQLVILTSV